MQKHVGSYCKQKGICLPVKLCQLSEKNICLHIIKYSIMPHQENPALVLPKGLNEAQGMEEDEYMAKHNYIKRLLFHDLFFRFKWSQMIYNFIATNQQTLQTFSIYCTLPVTKWVSLL